MLIRTISAVLALALCAPIVRAQDRQSVEDRLEKLEREMSDLKAQLKSRDEEIARLKSSTTAAAPTTAPASSIDQTTADVLKDIDSRERTGFTLRTPANFNPDLAVVVDSLASVSTRRSNDALNRFDVREAELDLRAAVDPRADGVVVLAFARDVENPVFPTGEAVEGPDTSVDIEEAYLFLHDFGVPNLTAKLGRYHLRFGRQNILHLHDLPTSDPPLVNQAFLAPEALSDAGLSLSYVIPPDLVGGNYIEAVLEIISGEGANSESPTLRGDLSVDSPAFNTHLLWNHYVARDWNLELGTSWLTGHTDSDNDHRVNLFGGDVTLIHTDPTGGFFNQLVQAEAIYGVVDQDDGSTQRAWGAYVLGQQQINRDWYTGVRIDWTQDANNDLAEAWAVSPYVSWYWSEFLRFRAEYQHKAGDVPSEDTLYFQATWIFGAHPPHPYWAMR